MKCISIIMPLYNAARFLPEALESVLRQTYRDFELICVNDGSTDSTIEILNRFRIKDDRIVVISNKTRVGAAISRNEGMKIAVGKYIAFLDGDDIFDEMMLEKAYGVAIQKDADIVMYESKHVPSDFIYEKQHIKHSKEYIDNFCTHTFSIQQYEPYCFLEWTLGPWNKLYKKKFIENKQLWFQDLPSGNDLYFVCMALMLSDKLIALDDENVMVYVRDHLGIERISYDRDPMCTYEAFLKISTELVERNLFADLFQYYYIKLMSLIRVTFFRTKTEEKKKAFYDFLRNEGIERLRHIGGSYYDLTDAYVRNWLEQFEKQDYKSQWHLEADVFGIEFHLAYHREDILALFQECADKIIPIGIWGAGKYGNIFLSFCKEHHLNIAAVIDKKKEKQGKIIQNYKIISPEEGTKIVRLIIVTADSIYEDVVKEVTDNNITIIDIKKILNII